MCSCLVTIEFVDGNQTIKIDVVIILASFRVGLSFKI